MALTINVLASAPIPGTGYRRVLAEITFDSSYPTGGESLAAANTNRPIGTVVCVEGSAADAEGKLHVTNLDRANNKLLVLAVGGEVANATDLSTYTFTRWLTVRA